MIKKFSNKNKVIFNKYSKYNFDIIHKFIGGIILKGWEVKSIRKNNINIKNNYIKIDKNNNINLIGLQINPLDNIKFDKNKILKNRKIKILLKKKEINFIINKIKKKKYTLILISLILKNPKFKTLLGLVKGKKKYDKKEEIKKKEWNIKKNRILKKNINFDL